MIIARKLLIGAERTGVAVIAAVLVFGPAGLPRVQANPSVSIVPSSGASAPDGTAAFGNGLGLKPGSTSSSITVGNNPVKVAVTPDSKTAYVVDFGTNAVIPISVPTNTALTPIPVGTGPYDIAITPDGTKAYVVNNTAGTVTPITVATNTPGTPITVGDEPYKVAFTPDGKTAYVVNHGSGTVTPITVATDTADTPIAVGSGPDYIAITPDGTIAYVAVATAHTVVPITVATNTAGTPIAVGNDPYAIAFTPDGVTAYVTDPQSNTVTPITVATNTAGTPIPVVGGPSAIVITPDGKSAYVTLSSGLAIAPISIAQNTEGSLITVGTSPSDIVISPDGKTLYAVNADSYSVTPVTIATGSAGTPISVGTGPRTLAISPDGSRIYVTNNLTNSVSAIDAVSNSLMNIGSDYPASGSGIMSVTPVAGVKNHWLTANPKTTILTGTAVTLTYSADNSTFVSDISTLPPSVTLYVKALLTSSNPNYTPSLDGLVIGNTPITVSFSEPSAASYVIGTSDGQVVSVPLAWNTTDTYGADHVRTRYSLDGGSTWSTISASLSTSATTDTWSPPSGTSTSTAKVSVEYLDAAGGVITSAVSSPFSVGSAVTPTPASATADPIATLPDTGTNLGFPLEASSLLIIVLAVIQLRRQRS